MPLGRTQESELQLQDPEDSGSLSSSGLGSAHSFWNQKLKGNKLPFLGKILDNSGNLCAELIDLWGPSCAELYKTDIGEDTLQMWLH